MILPHSKALLSTLMLDATHRGCCGLDIFTSEWVLINKELVFIADVRRRFLRVRQELHYHMYKRLTEKNLFKFM